MELYDIESRISACIERLKSAGLILFVSGLSDDDITALAQIQGLANIPLALRCYLRKMGRISGRFMLGSDFGQQGIPRLKEVLSEDLKDTEHPLPDDAFVFYGHQDYHFCYIRVSGENNPKVFTVYIRDGNSIQIIDDFNFVEWLENYVNSEIKPIIVYPKK